MRAKNGLWVAALALLSFLAVLNPHPAHASASAIQTQCQDGSFDANVQNNRTAYQQQLFNTAHNINTMFPVKPAMDRCLQQMANIFNLLPGLSGNPFQAIAIAIVNQVVQQLIQQASAMCNQIMSQISSTIQQDKTAIANMIKICIPLPKFGLNLDLPKFSASSCTGSIQVNTAGAISGQPVPYFGYSQYQSH